MRKNRKKGIKKIIILMTISLSLLMVVNNLFNIIISTVSGIENSIEALRLDIFIDYEDYEKIGEEIVSKINKSVNKHIIGAYSGGSTGGIADDNQNYSVTYIPENVLKEYMKTSKDLKLADNEVLLPKYVIQQDGMIKENNEDCIGKTVNFKIEKIKYIPGEQFTLKEECIGEKTYDLKVAGIYDNAKAGMSYDFMIVSNKTIVDMKFFAKPEQDENADVAMASSDTEMNLYVTIDDYKNAEEVLKSVQTILDEYEEYKLNASIYEYFATDEFYSLSAIKLLANIVASFLLVCASLSLFSYIKDMMNRRKQEFGIMKAIGYKTSGICKTLIKELILEITIPLGTSLALGLGSVIAADNYFKNSFDIYEYALMEIKLFPEILALVSGIAVILPLIGYGWTIIKINRLEPMEALKGSEGRV